eukprot:scaffold37498_cov32-Attheya_sp.AAC.2
MILPFYGLDVVGWISLWFGLEPGKFGLGRVADDGVEGVSLERLGGNGVDAPRVENESGGHHEPNTRETQEFAGARSHLGIL